MVAGTDCISQQKEITVHLDKDGNFSASDKSQGFGKEVNYKLTIKSPKGLYNKVEIKTDDNRDYRIFNNVETGQAMRGTIHTKPFPQATEVTASAHSDTLKNTDVKAVLEYTVCD